MSVSPKSVDEILWDGGAPHYPQEMGLSQLQKARGLLQQHATLAQALGMVEPMIIPIFLFPDYGG